MICESNITSDKLQETSQMEETQRQAAEARHRDTCLWETGRRHLAISMWSAVSGALVGLFVVALSRAAHRTPSHLHLHLRLHLRLRLPRFRCCVLLQAEAIVV